MQIGLRAEQTISNGNQSSKYQDSSFKKNYTKLFPTTYLSYKLNDSNTVSILMAEELSDRIMKI